MKKKLARRRKPEKKESVMREKYLVYGKELSVGGKLVFGIRYDSKKEELFVAGPKVFEDEADEIVQGYFGNEERSNTKYSGARVSWTLSVEREEWMEELVRLKEEFYLEEVVTFGRLTR